MFKGGSCYPISPFEEGPDPDGVVDANDQMIKILSKVNIEKRDLSFCSADEHLQYMNTMQQEAT